jgi:hypothetical protein
METHPWRDSNGKIITKKLYIRLAFRGKRPVRLAYNPKTPFDWILAGVRRKERYADAIRSAESREAEDEASAAIDVRDHRGMSGYSSLRSRQYQAAPRSLPEKHPSSAFHEAVAHKSVSKFQAVADECRAERGRAEKTASSAKAAREASWRQYKEACRENDAIIERHPLKPDAAPAFEPAPKRLPVPSEAVGWESAQAEKEVSDMRRRIAAKLFIPENEYFEADLIKKLSSKSQAMLDVGQRLLATMTTHFPHRAETIRERANAAIKYKDEEAERKRKKAEDKRLAAEEWAAAAPAREAAEAEKARIHAEEKAERARLAAEALKRQQDKAEKRKAERLQEAQAALLAREEALQKAREPYQEKYDEMRRIAVALGPEPLLRSPEGARPLLCRIHELWFDREFNVNALARARTFDFQFLWNLQSHVTKAWNFTETQPDLEGLEDWAVAVCVGTCSYPEYDAMSICKATRDAAKIMNLDEYRDFVWCWYTMIQAPMLGGFNHKFRTRTVPMISALWEKWAWAFGEREGVADALLQLLVDRKILVFEEDEEQIVKSCTNEPLINNIDRATGFVIPPAPGEMSAAERAMRTRLESMGLSEPTLKFLRYQVRGYRNAGELVHAGRKAMLARPGIKTDTELQAIAAEVELSLRAIGLELGP